MNLLRRYVGCLLALLIERNDFMFSHSSSIYRVLRQPRRTNFPIRSNSKITRPLHSLTYDACSASTSLTSCFQFVGTQTLLSSYQTPKVDNFSFTLVMGST